MVVKGSKNDPNARKGTVKNEKTYDGKPVKPTLYIGRRSGKKFSYMAIQYADGTVPEDSDNNPISWRAAK